MSDIGNVVNRNKLGPFLNLHLQKRETQEYKKMVLTSRYAFEDIIEEPQENDPIVNITLKIIGSIRPLIDKYENLKVRSIVDDMVTAEAPISVVQKLTQSENVNYIEASSPLGSEIDKCCIDTKVSQVRSSLQLTGKNVIIGIIDNGIDFTLDDFRNKDGSSRILFLWDQNPKPTGPTSVLGKVPVIDDGKTLEARELYGTEYNKEEIDKALRNQNPFLYVPQKNDTGNGHGTHVTGIAAGNGSMSNGTYMGIAPSSDIIFVKTWMDKNIGDSNTLIDGINYIFQKSDELDKPCCINISMGHHYGPHDGTSPDEIMIDKLVMQKKGRVIVKSAGNDGLEQLHKEGKVNNGETKILKLNVPTIDVDEDFISLWYSKKDELEISISSPNGETTPKVNLNEENKHHKLSNGNEIEISHTSGSQSKNGIVIVLKPGSINSIQNGKWFINITGKKVIDGRFDAWIDHIKSTSFILSKLPTFDEAINQNSISIPGTSKQIITVGNYLIESKINETSSQGPTTDGRIKPEITSPGTEIFSVASSQINWKKNRLDKQFGKYVALTGTSQAAPIVCGIVAILLEKFPNLEIMQLRDKLFKGCRHDSYTGQVPNCIFGFGRADVLSCI
jgi:subtilisin family serine protease